MLGRQYLRSPRLLCLLVAASVCLSLLPTAKAAGTDSVSKAQVRAAVKQAVEIAHPDANVDQLKFSDRDDLDEELSQISGTTARNISFYDVDWPSGNTGMWAVDTDGSPQSSSALYSFESTDGVDRSLQTFNRLLSHQAPIPDDKVESVARFFLACCVRDTPGEIVTSEDAMHHAVERYYLEAYGDVWRSLEAYTQWWHDYEQSPAQFTPAVVAKVVGRQVSLKRLVLSPGMHPQLEQWDIEVAPEGDVRVVSVDSIYPKQALWLSYAFRSTIAPLDFSQSDNDDDLPRHTFWSVLKDAATEFRLKILPPADQAPGAASRFGPFWTLGLGR